MDNICISCYYARQRKDICGIYCVGKAMQKSDGSCDKYVHYKDKPKEKNKRKV